jgi:hypothetical protein
MNQVQAKPKANPITLKIAMFTGEKSALHQIMNPAQNTAMQIAMRINFIAPPDRWSLRHEIQFNLKTSLRG